MNGKSTLLGRRVSALAVSVAYSMLVEIAAKVGGDIESVLHRAGREEGAALREELGLTLEPRDAVNFVWARLLGSRPEIEEREGSFYVRGAKIERLAAMTEWTLEEGVDRFQRILLATGVWEALEQAGIKPGDTVYIGDVELEWR